MIFDLIQIFRARRDKALSAKLAARFAQGQLIERASAPLMIVHLCLWAAALAMGILLVGAIATAIKLHWSAGLVGIIPISIGFMCGWISYRLKTSLDHIRAIASYYSDSHLDKLFGKERVVGDAQINDLLTERSEKTRED